MPELFLIGGLMVATAAAAAACVLSSSVGKKGGIPSAPRPLPARGVKDDYRRLK